ncbi:MAG: amidohydrolase family protein, partial [Phyllobacterium sp.]
LEPIFNAALLVVDGKIAEVGSEAQVSKPFDLVEIDLGPATLLPGLIDAHLHTFGVDSTQLHTLTTEHESYRAARSLKELRELLHAGFTSARCLGSTIGPQVKRAIDEGLADGPHLKVAGGFISSTSGTWDSSGTPFKIARDGGELADGVDGLVRAVRERVRQGADFIKLGLSKGGVHDRYHAWGDDPLNQVVTYSVAEVKAAVEEAHRNGLRVSAHAIGNNAVQLALDGGVDFIEHGYGITEETRARVVREKKIVVTTLSQIHFHREAYERFHYPQWEQEVYERHWKHMLRDFRLGLEKNVRFALGTDLVGAPTHPLKAAGKEFVLAVESGMSALQALQAGTVVASEVLGIETEAGSIEVGKRADLIATYSDPLRDVSAILSPLFVMKKGRVILGFPCPQVRE